MAASTSAAGSRRSAAVPPAGRQPVHEGVIGADRFGLVGRRDLGLIARRLLGAHASSASRASARRRSSARCWATRTAPALMPSWAPTWSADHFHTIRVRRISRSRSGSRSSRAKAPDTSRRWTAASSGPAVGIGAVRDLGHRLRTPGEGPLRVGHLVRGDAVRQRLNRQAAVLERGQRASRAMHTSCATSSACWRAPGTRPSRALAIAQHKRTHARQQPFDLKGVVRPGEPDRRRRSTCGRSARAIHHGHPIDASSGGNAGPGVPSAARRRPALSAAAPSESRRRRRARGRRRPSCGTAGGHGS